MLSVTVTATVTVMLLLKFRSAGPKAKNLLVNGFLSTDPAATPVGII